MSKSLRYPYQRIDGNSDYLQVRVLSYRAPGIGNNQNLFGVPGNGSGKGIDIPRGTIILPIPEGLSDMNGVTWESDRLTGLDAATFKSAKSVVDNPNIAAAFEKGDILGTATELFGGGFEAGKAFGTQAMNNPQIMDALVTKLTSEAANVLGANVDTNSIISRTTGQVLNPNLELLFKGVQLRTFSFAFKLTPRNSREGQEVKDIIATFKRRMAAKRNGSNGFFLNSPDIFELAFKTGNRNHPFLFSMKRCALKDMNVTYADTGAYATYEDATPVAMTLTLRFQELSPIYQEDYESVSDGVGF